MIKINDKQKKERKGPTESATKFNLGAKKKGNDGNMWIIAKNKNGLKRWVKISKTKKASKTDRKRETKKYKKYNKDEKDKELKELKENTELKNFWNKLASGKEIVVIYDSGNYKMISLPANPSSALSKLKEYAEDDNVKVILTSNMSYDAYELLENKSIRYGHNGNIIQILKNYHKYFKPEKSSNKTSLNKKLYYPF
jgi:predicted Fe-Mo cluster-binding NifX family protein